MAHYSHVILGSYLYIPKNELKRGLENARDKFTAIAKYDGGEHPMYHETKEYFGVPRHHFRSLRLLSSKVIDQRLQGNKVRFKFTSTLRPGQVPVMAQFKKYKQLGVTGFELMAPPGFGKTVVLLNMIQELQRFALIVVPRSNLVWQWVDRIKQHTSLTKIGVVCGDKVGYRACPIVVGLVHSIRARMIDDAAFHASFGTVVFDEVDRSVPPSTFSPVLGLFPAKYRIGASATVDRSDGLDVILRKHISQVRLSGEDVGRMSPKILMLDYTRTSGYVHKGSQKLNRRGMLLSRLSENVARNMKLAYYVYKIVKSDRRCLVLSDRTAQLALLRKLLMGVYQLSREDIGFYCDTITIGKRKKKIPQSEIDRSASACKVILGTYGKVAIGTDIPDLAGLVYATPQSDVRQTQGRIERLLEGKKQPVVVDFVDSYYEDAINWARKRQQYYKRKGLNVQYRGC